MSLEAMYARLALEEEEGGEQIEGVTENTQRQATFVLIGRFLTEKNINFQAMQNVLASIWRPREGMEIHDLGGLRYSFVFYHFLDLQKVIEGGPWTFEQNLLLHHKLEANEDAHSVQLNKMEIWVQIYDLPVGMMSEKLLENVGNYVGTFVKADSQKIHGGWKVFYRIRVIMDVDKPIKRRMKLKREGGVWSWINFKYERLRGGKNQNIGARWLRNGGDGGQNWRSNSGGIQVPGSADQAKNMGERFMEIDGRVTEVSGETGVIRFGQCSQQSGQHNLSAKIMEGIEVSGNISEDETVVMDSKRKRGNEDVMVDTSHSGGVALIWRNEGGCEIKDGGTHYIDFEVVNEQVGRWRYTGFYGCPERGRRQESWNLLKDLAGRSNLPWCIIGDFNDMMSADEKRRGRPHPFHLIQDFVDVVNECGLRDLGYVGDKYTWEKSRGKPNWIQERLDRGLANQDWCSLFPQAEVQNLEVATSDHLPLFLNLNKQVYQVKERRFKFENSWLREKECELVVRNGWNEALGLDIVNKINLCAVRLKEWGGGLASEYKRQGKEYRARLRKLRSRRDICGINLYNEVRWQYMNLLEKQEVYWKQRAKNFWLREGDNNTRFFHKYASGRRKSNRMKRIKDVNGVWRETKQEIQEVVEGYFSQLFTASGEDGNIADGEAVKRVSEAENNDLIAKVTREEVRSAVFSMHPDKSPGPDGLNPAFFQSFWSVVSDDVVRFCQQYIDTGVLPDGINHSVICLIPKVKVPQTMSDLRPISLCNVLVRILSKVMANRLKMCLGSIISDRQSAFIEGRLLTDNAMLAFEVNHYMKRKTQGKNGLAALKIDISKAYDRLEWGFVYNMMVKFGFHELWITRVMKFLQSVSYSFSHEDGAFGNIVPQRGLRQGDPISPYIYIMCAEGLSAMIRRSEQVGLVHGCTVARGAPTISHLLFADDCYFFFRANASEAGVMRGILNRYEQNSGQMVNYNKSVVTFSPNTTVECRNAVCHKLGVRETETPGRYLGVPMCVGRNKAGEFDFLVKKVDDKLQNWNNQIISRHGKVTLLKTAAQSIPNFWMQLFLIPNTVSDKIEKRMNAFWWGKGETNGGIKWLSWDRMCTIKEEGGLGFRKLNEFNIAMLAKQSWRLMVESNPLVSKLMKARYYPNSNFLNASLGSNPSYLWRSLMETQETMKRGVRKRIGNGLTTTVWKVPWLPALDDGYITTEPYEQLQDIKVQNLMDETQRTWDVEVVSDLFNERDRRLILQIPLPIQSKEDSWYWALEHKGIFSVKSCYRKIRDVEDAVHVLFTCGIAREVWCSVGLQNVVRVIQNDTVMSILKRVLEVGTREQWIMVGLMCWSLWTRRNKWVWERVHMSAFGIKAMALNLVADWKRARASEGANRSVTTEHCKTWVKPPEGWIKINIDASFCAGGSNVGIGCVARDSRGRFLRARCNVLHGTAQVREAEACSLKEALEWIRGWRTEKCIFESDAKLLVDAFQRDRGRSNFDTIVETCSSSLKHFKEVSIVFASRSANSVAHVLAQAAYSMSGPTEWFSSAPDFISCNLELDLN
ncbi:hypothetical protein AgCh_001488 [Apium graveolens]